MTTDLPARRAELARRADSPESERRALTRHRLLESGATVVAEQGVAATSVGALCAAAGFSRGAFYSNFVDMDDFVAQLARHQWGSLLEDVTANVEEAARRAASSGGTHPLTALTLLLRAVVPRDRQFFLLWTALSSHMVHAPERAQAVREEFDRFRTGLAGVVEDVVAHVGLRLRVDPLDVVDLLSSLGMRSLMLGQLSERDGADLLERLLPALVQAAVAERTDERGARG